jgi:hypothetical protein
VIDVPEQHCRPRERDRLIALGRRTDDDKRCTLLVVSEVDRLLNDDYFGLAQRVIGESHVPLWPDHILYLDVPQCVIEARNDGKFAPVSIFIDAGFNAGVRSYFRQVAGVPCPRVVWLDATVDATMVRALAAAQLGRWLKRQDCG